MLTLWLQHQHEWLEAHRMGFLRLLTPGQDPFRHIAALVLSFILVILLAPPVIGWLRRKRIGDGACFDQMQLDEIMKSKQGTPTMGGIVIIAAIVIATLLLADVTNFHVKMGLVCLLWLGGLGMVDDWLKLISLRRKQGRQGLFGIEKLLFQIGLGIVLSYFTYQHGRDIPQAHTVYFPFFKSLTYELGMTQFIILGTIVITGASNAVNLTDGLDGLAAGCMGIVSFGFFLLALLSGQYKLSQQFFLPHINFSGELALASAAMTGACLGFLWFNCNPARVFMGDTGSLAMGGLIGYIALVIRQEFMLVLVGGIFVIEAVSVLIQVYCYKFTRIFLGRGRRVFLVAPLHHHFQKKGWSESQVVVRFWLISAMLAALALASVKLR